MEYKFVELMSCQFQASSEGYIKQQVTYRYNAVKSRLALMQARLADINALVSCFWGIAVVKTMYVITFDVCMY